MSMVPQTKVFVGSLPQGSKPEDLRKLFERFGAVTECDIMNRCGFVHMQTEDQAAAAIRALNNTTFNGGVISVERGRIKERGQRGGGAGRGAMRGAMRGGIERRGVGRPAPYARDRGASHGGPGLGRGGGMGPGMGPVAGYDRERAPPGYDDRYNGYGGEDRRGFALMDRARDPYAAPVYEERRYDELAPMYGEERRAPMYDERELHDRRAPLRAPPPAMAPAYDRAAPIPTADMFSRRSPMRGGAGGPGGYDRDPYAQQYPPMGRLDHHQAYY